jgi:phage gp29-like protein
MAIAAVIRRHMIAPAVRLNFGRNVAIPGFMLFAPDAVDLPSFSLSIKNFTDAGLAIPAAWVREKAAMPAPKPGDELVGGGVATDPSKTPPPAPKPAKPKPGSKPPKPANDPGDADEADEAA